MQRSEPLRWISHYYMVLPFNVGNVLDALSQRKMRSNSKVLECKSTLVLPRLRLVVRVLKNCFKSLTEDRRMAKEFQAHRSSRKVILRLPLPQCQPLKANGQRLVSVNSPTLLYGNTINPQFNVEGRQTLNDEYTNHHRTIRKG
jgi:hypothetical protein